MLKTVLKIKKEVSEIINQKTMIYLRAMEQVEPVKYTAFAGTVAMIIAESNGVVKKRKQQPDAKATD